MTDTVKPFPILFVDGVDGTGKTTLVQQLKEALSKRCPDRPLLAVRLPENTGRVGYRDIVKSGPRTPVNDRQAASFHMEDALLNAAAFVSVMDGVKAFREEHPEGIVLFDRSPESVDCYQVDHRKNASFRYGFNLLRDELYNDVGPSWVFVLKPPADFIVKNLSTDRTGGTDVIDDLVKADAQGRRDLYRNTARSTRIMALTNPQTYLSDVLAVLEHQGNIPA